MATEGTIFCPNCGHQHESRPDNDVCVGCGDSFVVDLANPTRAEVERALQTRPRPSPRELLGVAALAGGLVIALAATTLLFLRCSSRDVSTPPQPPPGVIGLVPGPEPTPEQLELRRIRGLELTEGDLTREAIQAVISHNLGAVQKCYTDRLREQPGLSGTVRLEWTVDMDGSTRDVLTTSSDLPGVDSCIVELVRAWRFPASSTIDGTVVSYPFVFESIGF